MSIKITSPVNNQRFDVGDKVSFQGSADGGVIKVKLLADSQFSLGEVAVARGSWTIYYPFNTPGNPRRITVQGFDASSKIITEEKVNVVIEPSTVSCGLKNKLFQIGSRNVWQLPGQSAFYYKSGMSIDADGAPNAYHPADKGIDFLRNAGKVGNWWALVTDDGKPSGNPVVQKVGDPFPGFFVSTTALEDTTKQINDPRRFVDATKIPYIVLPGNSKIGTTGVKLGDFAVVFNGKNQKLSFAVFADIGPKDELGEGSIALSQSLGHNPIIGGKVKTGISGDLIYIVFPGSRSASKPWSSSETVSEINTEAEKHFQAWGSLKQLEACFRTLL